MHPLPGCAMLSFETVIFCWQKINEFENLFLRTFWRSCQNLSTEFFFGKFPSGSKKHSEEAKTPKSRHARRHRRSHRFLNMASVMVSEPQFGLRKQQKSRVEICFFQILIFFVCKPGTFRCGGGNAAQVVSCLFGARYKVTAISLYADEAERWDKAVKEAGGMTCNFQGTNKSVQSVPDLITKDPSAVKNCDVVLLTVPSSFHEPLGKCWNIENVSQLKAKGAKDLFDLSFLSDHPVLVPSAWSTLPPMWNGKLSVLVLAMLWMADMFYVGLLQLREYFSKLEPYVQPGTVFAVMPARSGCDFLFKKVPKVYGKKTNCTNYKRTILYTDNLWLYLWLLVW